MVGVARPIFRHSKLSFAVCLLPKAPWNDRYRRAKGRFAPMPGGRPAYRCADCKHKRLRCTHVAQSSATPPAEPELTNMPPRESHAPERFDDDERYRTARTGRRALDGKRRPSPSRTTPSKCARTESPVPRTNTPRPVLQGLLDSWLSALSVQAEVDKAAKLLALAETPTQIASQVQNHARPLASRRCHRRGQALYLAQTQSGKYWVARGCS